MKIKSILTNSILKKGKKFTSEKILKRCAKTNAKKHKKAFSKILKNYILNCSYSFKINTQVLKRGKRKTKRSTVFFLKNANSRYTWLFKSLIKNSNESLHDTAFFKKLDNELVKYEKSLNDQNLNYKNILKNKRYISKFKW